MKKIVLAAILTAAIATPAAAHYSKTTDNVTVKKMHQHAAHASVPMPGYYSHAKDVYVDGLYVGTDPDWFIRESLRHEYFGDTGGH